MTLKKGIRSIRSMDEVPAGTPRRYRSAAGYVRLRWRVGPGRYVEAYEHRLVMQFPPADVHHRDGSKDNNDPRNLEPLSRVEHARRHAHIERMRTGRPLRCHRPRANAGARARIAAAKRARRIRREQERSGFVARMAELYTSGLSTIEVGKRVGLSSSNVLLALRKAGVEMRTTSDYGPSVDHQEVARMHAEGVRASEMMRRFGIGRQRLYSIFDQLGLLRFTSGRPPKQQTYSPNQTNQEVTA